MRMHTSRKMNSARHMKVSFTVDSRLLSSALTDATLQLPKARSSLHVFLACCMKASPSTPGARRNIHTTDIPLSRATISAPAYITKLRYSLSFSIFTGAITPEMRQLYAA